MDEVSLDETYDLMERYTKRFKNFIKKLSEQEIDAIGHYKGFGGVIMNSILYGKPFKISKKKITVWFNKKEFAKKEYDKIVDKIKVIDSIFDKVPPIIKNKPPSHVYRGSNQEDNLSSGDTFITSGFLSTTLLPKVASGFIGCEGCCIFKFILNKPIPHIYLTWDTAYGSVGQESFIMTEGEILLPRNLKFKVLERKKVSLTKQHVNCSLEDIKNSKTKKITLYVCELEEIISDRTIPDVEIKII